MLQKSFLIRLLAALGVLSLAATACATNKAGSPVTLREGSQNVEVSSDEAPPAMPPVVMSDMSTDNDDTFDGDNDLMSLWMMLVLGSLFDAGNDDSWEEPMWGKDRSNDRPRRYDGNDYFDSSDDLDAFDDMGGMEDMDIFGDLLDMFMSSSNDDGDYATVEPLDNLAVLGDYVEQPLNTPSDTIIFYGNGNSYIDGVSGYSRSAIFYGDNNYYELNNGTTSTYDIYYPPGCFGDYLPDLPPNVNPSDYLVLENDTWVEPIDPINDCPTVDYGVSEPGIPEPLPSDDEFCYDSSCEYEVTEPGWKEYPNYYQE